MFTKNRMRKKISFLLGAVIAGFLVAAALVALVIVNQPKPPKPEPPTEPTYMPPEETELQPEDFQYDGPFLTCTAAPTVLGIDVSQFQKNIDWQQVKDAGIQFVIIRVGGRGYGAEGKIYADDMAQTYYEGAKAAGLKVGVYFFSQAITKAEARQEALYTLQVTEGWELEMPIVYDWEVVEAENSRTRDVDPRVITDCMKAFCEVIEDNGRDVMVYFNPDLSLSSIYLEELTIYDFWLAYYTDWNNYPYKVDMWQYTSTGSVPGIEGNVDINLFFPEAR